MENKFVCSNISKEYTDFSLNNISFELPAGYVLGIIGRNGCGKSTLIKSLLGWYPRSAGDAFIDGKSLKNKPEAYKLEIAFVLNETPFDALYTAEQIGLVYGRYYKNFDIKKYRKLLKDFGVSKKKWISSLSQGQQIRLQLAFALSYEASVYVFDEPAGNLDVEFRNEFYGYVREIMQEDNKTVLCSSHLIEELEEISDYILWLKREAGKSNIYYFGTAEELKEKYRLIECDLENAKEFEKLAKASEKIAGSRKRESHSEILVEKSILEDADVKEFVEKNASVRYADLKEIMYYIEKGEVK